MSIGSTIAAFFRTKAKGATAAGFPTSTAVDANTQALHTVLSGALPTGANTIGAVTGVQSSANTGSIIAASTVVGPVSVVNVGSVTVSMSGVYAGVSVVFEVSLDGTIWYPIQGRVTDGSIVNGFTGYTNASVAADFSLGAWLQFRVRATAWTSGTAAIAIVTKTSGSDRTPSSLAVGYTAPGNPVYSFAPLLIGGTDGVNARMAVFKAPSTAPAATDPALVVGFSPNSPTPAGTNNIGSFNLASGGTAIGTRADGYLRTQLDPTTLLFDTFETVDTTNTWTLGGTVVPTGASGVLTCSAGTLASGNSYAQSKATFLPGSSAFLQTADLVTLAAGVETGNKRVWGLGIVAGSPTAAVPLSNGSTFEILDTDGALYGAVYSNSVRTQSILLTRPTDGIVHRYAMYYKASRVYFEIDNVLVGSLGFPNPQVATLARVIGSFNGLSAVGTASTLNATLLGVADSGRNATKLADGTYPWRTMQIGKSGGISVKGASVTGTSGSIAAAGTGTVGPLDVSEAGNATFTIKNTIAGTPYLGNPVVVFEQSDDNVQWGPLTVVRADTGVAISSVTLVPNAANTSLMFDAGMEGVNWIRARVTTGPTTAAMTIVIQAGGMPFSPVVSVVQQSLTKAVQGATGVTTQDLKDSGRVNVAISCYQAAGIITTEALFAAATFSLSRDGAAMSTAQQFTVTAGKRLRIQSIECSIKQTGAVATTSKLVLRYSAAGGAISNASPILAIWDLGSNNVTAGNYIGPTVLTLPDGVELLANATYGFTNLSSAITALHTISMNGYEY